MQDLLPGARSEAQVEGHNVMIENSMGFDEEEPLAKRPSESQPQPHIQQQEHQKVFCKFEKNPFTHMTLQGEKPDRFDLMAQLLVVDHGLSAAQEGENLVLVQEEGLVGCTLRDTRLADLVEQIGVTTLVSTNFHVDLSLEAGDCTGQEASDLLQQMAEAGAFLHRRSQGFFQPQTDRALMYLQTRGLVTPAGSLHHYKISEKGASCFHARQTIGSIVSLEDFHRMLGLRLVCFRILFDMGF